MLLIELTSEQRALCLLQQSDEVVMGINVMLSNPNISGDRSVINLRGLENEYRIVEMPRRAREKYIQSCQRSI